MGDRVHEMALESWYRNILGMITAWWTEFINWFSHLGTGVIEPYCSSMFLTDSDILGTIDTCWTDFINWLSRPVWWITFTVVMGIIMVLGFGPFGIVLGSLAAGFQSFMYGGFTPAGGIFATLTSMAMLGTLMPAALVIAVLIATLVAWTW
ncbi:unnamed protein product [Penicillium salamii]|uniref:Uncharacterized protein n=1 Tax=Penicillium salamii TaxID=1612424 RepID=A0A9W4NYM1_9EURO|nr:unnamed protein product [Penicillium salamii]CAG8226578.1 unnamed protein product [Penicillium salamii]CAG8249839.1 unnamed protein product [Penicillium salamii]CAG8307391.1 unnamed protein product [Penicillium salamii]CAG8322513.1 unnamed protein product [Penicillium salamii]